MFFEINKRYPLGLNPKQKIRKKLSPTHVFI
jgi:hypothetical protein